VIDIKKILKSVTLKDVLIVALVPSVVTVGYYGYKAFKNYRDNKSEEPNKEGEIEVESEKKEDKKETKVIPINKDIVKDDEAEKKDIDKTEKLKEA